MESFSYTKRKKEALKDFEKKNRLYLKVNYRLIKSYRICWQQRDMYPHRSNDIIKG